ncbi:hypothetical protein LX70_04009 [Defluviimonas denitrificans]|uniref:Uncharacterized protein n=1 Tax=Albidovulum denitrificans TaxID=404881 RepID=A0A2S8RWK0_9RHOB|nr:hypothetical protein [Defluviimonas denitrificans]PQV52903.1 hypothetical protein LX70_04009 [Defluviimonas denitrificans]
MNYARICQTVGSYGHAWGVQLLDEAGKPVPLNGVSNVKFSMKLRNGTVRKVDNADGLVANGTYTFEDGSSQTLGPTDGILIYQPVAADVDTEGDYIGQFTYDLAGKPVIKPGCGYVEIELQAAV